MHLIIKHFLFVYKKNLHKIPLCTLILEVLFFKIRHDELIIMIFRYAILIIEWVTLEYVVVSNKGYNDLKKYIVLVI